MQIIPIPRSGQILAVVTPYVGGEAVFDLAARLSLAGGLEVIDGGNTFNAYRAVQALRRNAPEMPRAANALERVQLARAFTCYQLAALLEALEAAQVQGTGENGRPFPLLVLDLLATFGDQGVAVRERRRLLTLCLSKLKRLAQNGQPVGIWLRARTVAPEELLEFQARVEQTAERVWRLDHILPNAPQQGRLF
jgi:hypothetical protein